MYYSVIVLMQASYIANVSGIALYSLYVLQYKHTTQTHKDACINQKLIKELAKCYSVTVCT